MLRDLCGARICAEKLLQLTIQAGARQAEIELELARQAVSPTVEDVRKAREDLLRQGGQRAEKAPELLLVGLDGGWVPSREQEGGMEGKVRVIATEVEHLGKGRHRLTNRRYVATFGTGDEVGMLAYRAAEELGGLEARRQLVLADGGLWIESQAEGHFPEALCVLDWPHVQRAVH